MIASSCSGKKKTATNISINAGFLGSGVFTGGVMVWGEGPDGSYVAISLEDETSSKIIELDQGDWKFYASGWLGASTLLGATKCGFSETSLEGTEASVNLTMSTAGCNNLKLSDASFLASNQFQPIKLIACHDITGKTQGQNCDGTTTKGSIASYKLIFNEYKKSLPKSSGLTSDCINETAQGSSSTSTAYSIPVGSLSSGPLNFSIRTFTQTNCTGLSKEINFSNGLINSNDKALVYSSGSETEVFLNVPIIAPNITAYTNSSPVYSQNVSIPSNFAFNNGGSVTSFSISPALPAGLTINATTGEISGTPTASLTATTFTVTATGPISSGTFDLVITVLETPPVLGSYTNPTNSLIIGQTSSTNTVTATGTVSAFSISPALPSGLTFNTANGDISGTPTISSPNTTYTITATNSGGSDSTTIDIEVLSPALLTYSIGSSYDFGGITYANLQNNQFTITNSGDVAATTVNATFATGTDYSFTGGSYPGSGGTCGTVIAAGSSCTVDVQFIANNLGAMSDTLSLNYNDGVSAQSALLNLSGQGLSPANLTISESDPYDYGVKAVGSSNSHIFTITNVGDTDAQSITESGLAAPFAFNGGSFPGTGGDCSSTLTAYANCSIDVVFSPASTGASSDTITIDYDSGAGFLQTTRSISGTGATPALLSISGGATYDYHVVHAYPVAPNSSLGSWNASSNIPVLANGTGTSGQYYVVSAAGTYDLGSGPLNFKLGDWVIYDGTSWLPAPPPKINSFTISNTGGSIATSITPISLSSEFRYSGGSYPGAGGDCGTTLAAAGSCTIEVEPIPLSVGVFNDTIQLDYNNGVSTQSTTRSIVAKGGAVKNIVSDGQSSCALFNNGKIKCWGVNSSGQLGYGDTQDRGDEAGEMGSNLGFVDIGSGVRAREISAGTGFFCVITNQNDMKCWGQNTYGQLGYADTAARGASPTDMGNNLLAINLGSGRTAKSIATGATSACAILDNNTLKCWGQNNFGQLGLENTTPLTQPSATPVDLGTALSPIKISMGSYHACAILNDNSLKCWGKNTSGQLGANDTIDRGSSAMEMGDYLPTVTLSGTPTELSLAGESSCIKYSDDTLSCWGKNTYGQLGDGTTTNILYPSAPIGLGGSATGISISQSHTCSTLVDGSAKCWGRGMSGQLGTESTSNELNPNSLAAINLGTSLNALKIMAAGSPTTGFSCAELDNHEIKCWGANTAGQLGYGDTVDRGANGGDMGDNLAFVELH